MLSLVTFTTVEEKCCSELSYINEIDKDLHALIKKVDRYSDLAKTHTVHFALHDMLRKLENLTELKYLTDEVYDEITMNFMMP